MPVVIDDSSSNSSGESWRPAARTNSSSRVMQVDSDNDLDEDDDDMDVHNVTDDHMDDYFSPVSDSDPSSTRRIQALLPDDYGDEAMAGIRFAEEFANRYGAPHPIFFPGSLDDAIKESCNQPPKEVTLKSIKLSTIL
jgi:hypothetical protein